MDTADTSVRAARTADSGQNSSNKPPLTVLLAAPRGFCAGVDRAIHIVERALEKFGRPVYVRHEIVHNRYVVQGLEAMGAVFIDELEEIPPQHHDRPVVFSAHGVPKAVPADARARNITYIDATCPLVSKVHREAERHHAAGRLVVLIGHAGHPEVIGTMGQLPPGSVVLVETAEQAATIDLPDDKPLAFCTQTTLSVDDTAEIVAALTSRFPEMSAPRKEDICYATTNRQQAVKAMADRCDLALVVGAPNSSNSRRLVEVAERAGCQRAFLVQRATDIDWSWFDGVKTLGITAGASAPETLVEEVVSACRDRFNVTTESITTAVEDVVFKIPAMLQSPTEGEERKNSDGRH
jgi:4-hydroxy-3-methylbut-2-en-1-yl diphosphate reductase